MTEKPEQHGKKPRIEKLDLNQETVADLTEGEAEDVQGGLMLQDGARKPRLTIGGTCYVCEVG